MLDLLVSALLIGNVVMTSYRSVPAQTKPKDCEWTSIGERCNVHGVAVSQDLLTKNGGPLNYGDLVFIEGVGFKFVNDCMAARWKQRIDVWVPTYNDEKKFGVRKGRLWLIRRNQ